MISHRTRISSAGFLLVAICLLTACSGESSPNQNAAKAPPEPQSQGEVAPESLVPETPELCSAKTEKEIRETILSQNRSFTERDWVAAHSYSSQGFQSSISLDVFERLISRNYEMLLYFEDASFGSCEMSEDGTNASIFVEVRSTYEAPVIMEYDLVSEDLTWKIFAVTNPVGGVPNA